jgi:hypothetical protein
VVDAPERASSVAEDRTGSNVRGFDDRIGALEMTVTNTEIAGEVIRWHDANGGHFSRPAGHAVRMLREMIELCVAIGATENEIRDAVDREIAKAEERGQWGGNPAEVGDECADVAILLDVLTKRAAIDIVAVKQNKLAVLWARQWEADADGVLWRPGTKLQPGT